MIDGKEKEVSVPEELSNEINTFRESPQAVPFLLVGGDPNWVENESSYAPCFICQTRCFVGTPHPRIAICSDFCRASLLRKQDEMKVLNPERAKRGRPLNEMKIPTISQTPDSSGVFSIGKKY